MGNLERPLHLGSDAFCLEYDRETPTAILRKDIESYLGEYRFAVDRYRYELLYRRDAVGDFHLVNPHNQEPMAVSMEKAIQKRRNLWKSASREEAEYQGLLSLEAQLANAAVGDAVLWTSPPGPPEDGYANYGFFYLGQIAADLGGSKQIDMTAIRINHQTVSQCRQALQTLVGSDVHFQKAEDCLASPRVVPPVGPDKLKHVLSDVFHFRPDWKKERLFADIMEIVKPQMEAFIHLMKYGESRSEIQKGLWALENYVIALQETAERQFAGRVEAFSSPESAPAVIPFNLLMAHFGRNAPPPIAGSCGSSAFRSSNLFNSCSFVQQLFSKEASENFVCPNCYKESPPPVGDHCPKCGITKDEAEKKGLTTC